MNRTIAIDRADQLAELLDWWVSALPDPAPSWKHWVASLTGATSDVIRAMGLPTDKADLVALRSSIESDAPTFHQFKSSLNQRLQIYLGGLEGIVLAPDAPGQLIRHAPRVRNLRLMLSNAHKLAAPRTARTLTSVARALDVGSLRDFTTTEVDSDLWVVLKTMQENWDSGLKVQQIRLLSFTEDTVRKDMQFPGRHISDRRHAWWAARTLLQAKSIGLSSMDEVTLGKFLEQLLNEQLYVSSNDRARQHSVVLDFHEEIVGGWELINISEIVRGWRGLIQGDVFRMLAQREHELVTDLVMRDLPTDMRVATVYLRALMTYLSEGVPMLWGKDV